MAVRGQRDGGGAAPVRVSRPSGLVVFHVRLHSVRQRSHAQMLHTSEHTLACADTQMQMSTQRSSQTARNERRDEGRARTLSACLLAATLCSPSLTLLHDNSELSQHIDELLLCCPRGRDAHDLVERHGEGD